MSFLVKKLSLFWVFLALAVSALADSPMYSFSLKDNRFFTVEGNRTIDIHGLSERLRPMVQESKKRKIAAAHYSGGVLIRTPDAGAAAQEVISQISDQSGVELGFFNDTAFAAKTSPVILLMAVNQKSVWHVLLTPKEEGLYLLSLTCVVDE